MEEIIALLKFAVDNEHNFTERDPDGVKRAWIEQARKALAAQSSARRTSPTEANAPHIELPPGKFIIGKVESH